MWLYLLIFLIPVLLYFFNGQNLRKNQLFLATTLFCLAFFVGLSDMFGGYDRYIYGEVFDNIADITTEKGSYIKSGIFETYFIGEFGYTFLNILVSFITENRYIFILIVTMIIYTCLYVSLRRYTEDYPIAIILFLGLWFFFSFTYLRQVLGATIVWLGIQYVVERKFLRFLFICFIGYSLHNSALIFFPLYFLPIKKIHPKTVVFFLLILLLIGLSPVPNSLFEAYGSTSVIERRAEYNASGVIRVPYILEAFFFAYLILKNYNQIPCDKIHILLMNMALIFCGILLFFVRSENGGRLSWYYMIGIISTLSLICTYKKNVKTKVPVLLIILSIFLYLRIYTQWQDLTFLYPYKTFLSNGIRENDIIHEGYEYNNNYDKDKFCRNAFRFTPNF